MPGQALPPFPKYVRHRNADARIASAQNAVLVILAATILPGHKRELLSTCLWKLSLADCVNKYSTRFVSPAALGMPIGLLAHEHVHERRRVIEALMQGRTTIDALPSVVFGCTVLRTEHEQLSALRKSAPDLEGWDRYRKAGVAVIDREQGMWLIAP